MVERTIRVLKGKARKETCRKMRDFIRRHRKQDPGKIEFGEGGSKVSAHTAGLRNWGYDPTGKYSG